MAETTGIEWTDHTFNPWLGCTKVSPACDRCYAEAWAKRTGKPHLWAGERQHTSAANWRQPQKWNVAARQAGVRRKVFCASLADVFDNQVPDRWRADLWSLIAACDALDWLLLTKRPQNIAKMLPGSYVDDLPPWPWPHVWLGTTTENQEEADRRIPHLLAVPAAQRFISAEPLLGPVNLRRISTHGGWYDAVCGWRDVRQSPAPEGVLDLVIVGGESGPGARAFNIEWARRLIAQCRAGGVACFVKQLGARPVETQTEWCEHLPVGLSHQDMKLRDRKGGDWSEWPEDLRVREMPL